MKKIITTKQFLRDLKKQEKRNSDLQKIREIIQNLALGKTLNKTHRPHKLKGEFSDFWECHIDPDWLLIYKAKEEKLYLVRTGSHADLF